MGDKLECESRSLDAKLTSSPTVEVGISSPLVLTVPACPSQIEHLYGLTVFECTISTPPTPDNANAPAED